MRFEDMEKDLQKIRAQTAMNRIDYIPSGSLKIREPVMVPNSAMTDENPTDKGKRKKRRSPTSRARYREKRRLRRLQKAEGCAISEHGSSEYETDETRGLLSRPISLSPTYRGRPMDVSEDCAGLAVHSNKFDMLEDDPVEEESSLAMVLHDGTTNARITNEAKVANDTQRSAANNGSSIMEIASNGDRRPAIEAPVKKARVSTSRTA